MANDKWGYERTYNKFIIIGDVEQMIEDTSAYSNELEVVALASASDAYKRQIQDKYNISENMVFADLASVLKNEKFADVIILEEFSIKDFSTAIKILQKGYELFFAKSDTVSEKIETDDTYDTVSDWLMKVFNRIVAQADDRFVIVLTGADITEYENQQADLVKNKYLFYASNILGDNVFSTYHNDAYVINLGYYAYENAVRLVVEEKDTLYLRESDNVWVNNEVQTSLALIGAGNEELSTPGLSCCYQLADGSFIVIDGGWHEDAEYLFKYLNAKKTSEKIIIAAWIFTHNDFDHKYCFSKFMEDYASEVTVEQIIYNFKYDGEERTDVLTTAKKIDACEIVIAHTGQKMHIRNAIINILYSLDSMEFAIRNNNWHSLAFTVDIDGQRTLFLGDVTEAAATVLLKMYGDHLKSDIVQLSHHGIRNGTGLHMDNTYEMYKRIHADVVLWPNCESNYRKVNDPTKNIGMHYWNITAVLLSKEMHLAGVRGNYRVFELPYRYNTSYTLL